MAEQNPSSHAQELQHVQNEALAALDDTRQIIGKIRLAGQESLFTMVPVDKTTVDTMGEGLSVTQNRSLGLDFAEDLEFAQVDRFSVFSGYIRAGAECMLPEARALATKRIAGRKLLGFAEAAAQFHGQLTDWSPALEAIENSEDVDDIMSATSILAALLSREAEHPRAARTAELLSLAYKVKTQHIEREPFGRALDNDRLVGYATALTSYRANPSAQNKKAMVDQGGGLLVALDTIEAALVSGDQPEERWCGIVRDFVYSEDLESSDMASRVAQVCWSLRWLPELSHVRNYAQELDDATDARIAAEIAADLYEKRGIKEALRSIHDTYDWYGFDQETRKMVERPPSRIDSVAYQGLLGALVTHGDMEAIRQAGAFVQYMDKARSRSAFVRGAMYEWQAHVHRGNSFAEAFSKVKTRPEIAWRNQAIRLLILDPGMLPRVEQEFKDAEQEYIAQPALGQFGDILARFAMRDGRPRHALEYAKSVTNPHARYGALLSVVALTEKHIAKLVDATEDTIASSKQ